ncbi:MAG: hypothetical protein E3K37_00750 [Candidatus Kuenenia sp.]|nr:hypothetical protein [Candidatus Kuenenia hertensis]
MAEIVITITVTKDGYSAPTTAKRIKLKSLSREEIFKNAKLTSNTYGSESSAVLQYNNNKNAESIKVIVKIKEGKETIKLNTTGDVLLLPDAAVSSIDVYDNITQRQETTITAKFSELNGDTEASADISFLVGYTVIERSSIIVKPGETTDVAFNTTFDTAGTHNVIVNADQCTARRL